MSLAKVVAVVVAFAIAITAVAFGLLHLSQRGQTPNGLGG